MLQDSQQNGTSSEDHGSVFINDPPPAPPIKELQFRHPLQHKIDSKIMASYDSVLMDTSSTLASIPEIDHLPSRRFDKGLLSSVLLEDEISLAFDSEYAPTSVNKPEDGLLSSLCYAINIALMSSLNLAF